MNQRKNESLAGLYFSTPIDIEIEPSTDKFVHKFFKKSEYLFRFYMNCTVLFKGIKYTKAFLKRTLEKRHETCTQLMFDLILCRHSFS